MPPKALNQLSLLAPSVVLNFAKNEAVRELLLDKISGQAEHEYCAVHFCSASVIVDTSRNRNLHSILSKGISFCDSRPLQLYLRFIHRPKFEVPQTRGPSFFRYIMENPDKRMRHFFVAPSLNVVEALVSKYRNKSNLNGSVSFYVPPLSDDIPAMAHEMIKHIRDSGANLVWIGIGAPKQIVLADILSVKLPIIALTVGGAMETVSGLKKEAPIVLQKLSLEWLYRWKQEPKRLARRYTIQNMEFLCILIRDLASQFIAKVISKKRYK